MPLSCSDFKASLPLVIFCLRKDELPIRRILKSQLMDTCHLCSLTHILRLSMRPNSGDIWDTFSFTLGETETSGKKAHPSSASHPLQALGLVLLPPDPQPNTLSPTLLLFETHLGKVCDSSLLLAQSSDPWKLLPIFPALFLPSRSRLPPLL